MNDNLIFYINKLSFLIVAEEFENDDGRNPDQYNESNFLSCVKKVKQKGCDVLLKHDKGVPVQDPCITDYGGNWSPVTLITDYGRELQAQGGAKQNDLLVSCLATLQEKPYNCVNNLLKLLLLLKKTQEPSISDQNDLTSDFFLDNIDALSLLNEDFSNASLQKSPSCKKSFPYQESWTKQFDSKFQLLGEFSRKNLSPPDKVSLKSIISTKPIISTPSRSNSFGFTDFFFERNYKSEKNLFDINSNHYINENPMLDSFVDRPISHKLPAIKLNPRYSCKSGFLETLTDTVNTTPSLEESTRSRETTEVANVSRKSSAIELKRNSNCSHSFSILYEKSVGWAFGSSESFRSPKKTSTYSSTSTSKEIILGLWEQEQSIIKEFRPELAPTFPALRMITLAEFIEDVKYLFTGINSDTFKYDTERNGFNMMYGTCLDDVTPESLFHFSAEFIEVGDCYVKLISCVYETGKNNFDTCTSISQAFWKSIFDYLELHYSLVLEISPSINLMALKSCTRDLHEIIKTVANICMVDTPKKSLPEGGELLTYLLKFAERISRDCVTNIVFGILQNCCRVYYLCTLQNWMFKGRLDGQNEFFVAYRGRRGKPKSRSYCSSFFLLDEKIPSFLRGFEESIFNCGKSIHFLKLFNPDDTFCQILERGDYPSMRICFADDQFDKLETDFKLYEDTILRICGSRITVKTIKEKEAEKERRYQEHIAEIKRFQEKERMEARLKKQKEREEIREEKNKLLRKELSLIEAEKERKREEERMEELKLEMEFKKINEARENMLNEEISFLIETYSNIMDNMDKDTHIMDNLDKEVFVSEVRSESLMKNDDDTSENTILNSNFSDDINCNEIQTDQEGNITNQLDENSNTSSVDTLKEDGTEKNCYDVNSNPCNDFQQETPKVDNKTTEEKKVDNAKIRKSVSQRTIAAEEALRNKHKILKSEFGLAVKSEPNTSEKVKPKESLSDLERNRQKVLMSEYNILLKNVNTNISITSVPHNLQVVKDNVSERGSGPIEMEESPTIQAFATVPLERKEECTDLNRPREKSVAPSQSSDSSQESSNELSGENASNASEEIDNRTSSMTLRDKYLEALSRDVEIFSKKSSHQDIFCSLKEEEIDSLPCTDFLKFQRYLRKSVLIPLKVQEKLANDALLKHILSGENLLGHLDSLRGYFFLNDGEFGRSFTQQMFRSLAKCTDPREFFERSNLSNIVNEALNYTIHNSSPNSKFLSFRIVNMPPFLNHSSHDVLSPFELSYKVEWPLNFILTEKALSKYKMVFKFLLKLKRIKWTMNENFLYLNSLFKNAVLNRKMLVGSPHYHKIQIFRHAITQVMITLDDYIFSNGVQCSWLYFLKDLETTENIDHLYQKHVRYIKDVLKRCFLSRNSEDLINDINNLIELALKFHYTVKCSSVVLADGKYEHPKFQVLKTTFHEFCSVLKNFLKCLKEKIGSNEVLRSHYVLIEKFDLKLT